MEAAHATEQLPVYFVMRDRLGYDSFFPRVQAMHIDERRATVVRELKAHAQRTQAPAWDRLCVECDRGNASDVTRNWLGNFLRVKATANVIDRVAAMDAVWEVHLDAPRPREAYEDCPSSPLPLPPGNGPMAVNAYGVWAMGFSGQGIVVVNADSGINTQHFALSGNLWENPGEIPSNGIDDDGNGFIDDYNGWNFATNTNQINDNGSHGTQTAGVLVGNGACGLTVGISPNSQLITAAISTEADQWASVQYAIDMGAHVHTSSHSYKNDYNPPPNYALHRDVAEMSLAAGLIRTNSTSNNGGLCTSSLIPEIARPFNISAPGNVPPPYRDPNQVIWGRKGGVIGIGSHLLNSPSRLDSSSPCGPYSWYLKDLLSVLPTYPLANWDPLDNDFPWVGGAEMGLLKPDLVAPTGTLTTVGSGPSCSTAPFGGTSNATPVAAGCMMLWKGANMSLTPEDIAMIAHQSAIDEGVVPGKENDWGAGRIDAMEGIELALAVHRVNNEPAWEVMHRSGKTLRLEIDGSPNQPACIAIGLVRQNVTLGPVVSGIGTTPFVVFSGDTGPTGSVSVDIPVRRVDAEFTVYSQAFIDDRVGPTGKILTSNVIGIDVVH